MAERWFLEEHPEVRPGTVLPFGYCHFLWLKLRAQMRPGDEIWEFDNRHTRDWQLLARRTGICLVRDGEAVETVIQFQS